MSSCLTVIHTFCPVYLVDELVLVFYTASWLLKQRHQGLLKLHVHLGGVPVRGENDAKRKSLFEGGNLQKRNFVWSRKITCEEAFQDLSKSCVSSGGRLNGSNKEKNGQATEKRASLVKHRETPLGCWGLGGRWVLVKIPWDYFTFFCQRKISWEKWSYILWSIRWCHVCFHKLYQIQKQLLTVILQNSCSRTFWKNPET